MKSFAIVDVLKKLLLMKNKIALLFIKNILYIKNKIKKGDINGKTTLSRKYAN